MYRITKELFIEQANIVHDNRYDYSKVQYCGSHHNIIIICNVHGDFKQTPSSHKSGRGCPKCAQSRVGRKNAERGKRLFSMSQEEFIKKAQTVHNHLFSYTAVKYINYYTKITVNCHTHGNFQITPDSHLHGTGCALCAHTTKYSKKAIRWIESISTETENFIQHAGNIGEYTIPNTRIKVDGYCRESNTVYEFHGSKWHGDPSRFEPEVKCHPYDKELSAGELYTRTIIRENKIRQLGYNLVVCWESEFT